jgi:hypothetical protein
MDVDAGHTRVRALRNYIELQQLRVPGGDFNENIDAPASPFHP